MIYKVGVNGVTGRMGVEVASLLGQGLQLASHYLELADAVANSDKVTSVEGVTVRTWKSPSREPVHVWVDFSRPAATMSMLESIDTPVVICTTGFSESELAKIENYSKRHAVLLAANTSPGMSVVRKFLAQALPPKEWGFSAHVEDIHHRHKKDAPSGSAKEIVRLLEKAGYEGVQVHAIRTGGVVGEHEIRLISDNEEVSIVHRAFDRRVFAKGSLLGAVKLLSVGKSGLYSWDELFSDAFEGRLE